MKTLIALCVLLAGCAAPVVWQRADQTDEALYRETAQCRFESAGAGMATEYLYRMCMHGKGWHEATH